MNAFTHTYSCIKFRFLFYSKGLSNILSVFKKKTQEYFFYFLGELKFDSFIVVLYKIIAVSLCIFYLNKFQCFVNISINEYINYSIRTYYSKAGIVFVIIDIKLNLNFGNVCLIK